MPTNKTEALFFAGSSHPSLAKEVALALGIKLGQLQIERFPDGEVSVQVGEEVSGKDVFVLQTTALEPNDYLVELLIIVEALKRGSANRIIAVIPYFAYCRQDRKDRPGEPITAKLVANLLECAGVSHIITVDLHSGQIQGFFDIPVDNLVARSVQIEVIRKLETNQQVVVAADMGCIKLARALAHQLKADIAVIDKKRYSATHVNVVTLIGDVKGKDVLLADDMCTTGSTLVSAAKACHEKGAKRIFATVTHGLFVGNAIELIEQSPIEALIVSDTVPYSIRNKRSTKIKTVSIAPLLTQAMQCVMSHKSVSSLYGME